MPSVPNKWRTVGETFFVVVSLGLSGLPGFAALSFEGLAPFAIGFAFIVLPFVWAPLVWAAEPFVCSGAALALRALFAFFVPFELFVFVVAPAPMGDPRRGRRA